MLRMRKQPWLEDGSKVGRGHLVQIRLGSEDGQKIKNVQQQLSIEGWQFGNEVLISTNGLVRVKGSGHRTLKIHGPHSLSLMVPQWIAEEMVEVQGNDGFRQLVEISAENVCSVVYSVAAPIQTLAISVRRIKGHLQFFDSFLRATQPEDTFDIGGCTTRSEDES